MDTNDQEWIAQTLKEYERRQCISKILSIDCKDAVPKGNNYGSDMKRLNLRLVLNSGDVENRTVICKMLPKTELRRKLVTFGQRREAKILREILPEIERIRSNVESPVERVSPVCYGVHPRLEGILLEDLSVLGFKMADRKKGLDFQHAELAVNSFAEFHAATKVLIEQGDISITEFGNTIFDDVGSEMETIIFNAFKNLLLTIEEKWQGEWLSYGNKLREMIDTLTTRLREAVKIDSTNFNTLVHGDCWSTNMMFRYKEGKPQSIRLLDFQMCRYGNVCLDLTHFFNSSLCLESFPRRQELVKIYYNKLISSLSLYGYSGPMPTCQDIMDCYEKISFWGLAVGVAFRPQLLKPDEEVPDDLEEWVKEFSSDTGLKPPSLEDEGTRDILECILKEYFQ